VKNRRTREERIAQLEGHRALMVTYASHRLEEEDWHGVMDAAADLREIDTELRVLRDSP
jgi:hypothetical protein